MISTISKGMVPPLVSHRMMQSTPGLLGRLQCLHGILRIGLVAVEKVLGVVEDLRACGLQVLQRVVDQLQVLFQGDPQRLVDMEIPALAEDGDGIRLGLHQGADVLVLVRRDLGAAGRAERGDLGLGQFLLLDVLEKSDVLGIASRPSTLDVMDAAFVKLVGDADLVLYQEGDILRLSPVTQGRIVQFYQGSFHHLIEINARLTQG